MYGMDIYAEETHSLGSGKIRSRLDSPPEGSATPMFSTSRSLQEMKSTVKIRNHEDCQVNAFADMLSVISYA